MLWRWKSNLEISFTPSDTTTCISLASNTSRNAFMFCKDSKVLHGEDDMQSGWDRSDCIVVGPPATTLQLEQAIYHSLDVRSVGNWPNVFALSSIVLNDFLDDRERKCDVMFPWQHSVWFYKFYFCVIVL